MPVHHPRPRYGHHPERAKPKSQDALFDLYKQLVGQYANGNATLVKFWMDKALQALRDSR